MTIGSMLANDTVRIKVRFVDTDPNTDAQIEVEPSTVSVSVYDESNTLIITDSAVALTPSQYYYDFTPTEAGEYKITFIGTFIDTSTITVNQRIYVSTPSDEYKPSITLKSDETIVFAADLEPLYLNPEELLSFYPDATLLEIGEIVHSYSLEVKQLNNYLDTVTGADIPFNALEYIKAATACELSRTYAYGSPDDEMSVQLGDLTVVHKPISRTQIDRSSATTWCQLAAVIRREMLTHKTGPKNVQWKGLPTRKITRFNRNIDPKTGKSVYLVNRELYAPSDNVSATDDPMPVRGMRSYD